MPTHYLSTRAFVLLMGLMLVAPINAHADELLFLDKQKIIENWSVTKAETATLVAFLEEIKTSYESERSIGRAAEQCASGRYTNCEISLRLSNERLEGISKNNDEVTKNEMDRIMNGHNDTIAAAAERVRVSRGATAILLIDDANVVAFDPNLDVTQDVLAELKNLPTE